MLPGLWPSGGGEEIVGLGHGVDSRSGLVRCSTTYRGSKPSWLGPSAQVSSIETRCVGYSPPTESSPRRPIVTASEYEALLAVSDTIHPLFRLALIIVHETGHRIGAVRLLRWTDIDFEHQVVRWRGENDKIGYEHETWLTPGAVEALQAARRFASRD